jgi:hypothetical protein
VNFVLLELSLHLLHGTNDKRVSKQEQQYAIRNRLHCAIQEENENEKTRIQNHNTIK